jgi:RNA polymerase sigma factor (sigma-70 family)
MARYQSKLLAELAVQQRYVPRERRLEQLDRAETLLGEIDAAKEYPYGYVCYRITGHRSDEIAALEGESLRQDLVRFIEDVSESVGVSAESVGEPVLTVEELSRQYKVSTKTISRWRERGLVSRRFVFDGRKRLGFLKSSVDRFVASDPERIERGGRFSQLSEEEKEAIVRRARRMTRFCDSRPTEIVHRIARKFGRSPETIRYTLHKYDQECPSRAVFTETCGPLCESDKSALYRAYRRGVSVEALAEQYHRTRSTVYRVINEMRARRLLEQKIEFMQHPCFDEPDAENVILAEPPPPERDEVSHGAAPKGLPPYLASLYDVPLLTKEQEIYLFRKMNFLKYRAATTLKQIDPLRVRAGELDQIEHLLEEALAAKNQIIRANLRLVVSIAKRHVGDSDNFFELVSDGNMSLIRAVEKFDFGRGNKFSTYASWAIMKNFARSIPEELSRRDRFVTGHDDMFESKADDRGNERQQENALRQMRGAIASILDKLDERERTIIVARFGLAENTEPRTLEEIGREFGVTKERIRQLETRALNKLRRFASEAGVELPD